MKKIVEILERAFFWLLRKAVRSQLKFDRFIIKRYLNLETPLYKLWWNTHAKSLHEKLQKQHK